MSQYITLLGAEEVSRAASAMRKATDDFKLSVERLDFIMSRQEEWLTRLETALREPRELEKEER